MYCYDPFSTFFVFLLLSFLEVFFFHITKPYMARYYVHLFTSSVQRVQQSHEGRKKHFGDLHATF
jgi:hypothetical protein